jgi:hypothetical protein
VPDVLVGPFMSAQPVALSKTTVATAAARVVRMIMVNLQIE